ncbi:MAG: hypothetical protein L0Y35_05690, partial [Flammeovirgaceae bacterium]|nr:hypothetical protein [Flammeovirgaceae bacterium]
MPKHSIKKWQIFLRALNDTLRNKAQLTSFKWKERRILLPTTINGEKTSLYFDTGTSAFELLTSKSIFERLIRHGAPIENYRVNSWGNTLQAFSALTDHRAEFVNVSIPLKKVTYIEGTSLVQNLLMRISGMGGMTGNKL